MTTDEFVEAPVNDLPSPAERRTIRPAVVIALVTLAVALPLIVAVIALAGRRWFPVLDLAMTEFRIRDAGGRHSPLIGLPGRIGTFPDQGSHPGPLSFWMLAPGYRLFGSSAWAMEAATLVLQLGWIAVALWLGHRRARYAGVAMIAVVIALLIRGYGLSVLIQPWNPYVPLFAWIVVLLATWSVLSGDHMMLIPLVVAASFTAQTHIPYLIMSGGLGVFAAAVVITRWWRSDDRRPFRAPLGWTAGLFAVLWVGPVIDQLRRDPGNIRRLLDHFGSPTEPVVGVRRGVSLLFRHFDVTHAYARWSTETYGRFLLVGFEPSGTIVPGVMFAIAWVAAFAVSIRLRHRSLVALHTTIAVTLLLTVVSMVRIFGTIWYYLTMWAWGTTTLMIVGIVWTVAAAIAASVAARRESSPCQSSQLYWSLQRVGIVGGAVVVTIMTVPMVIAAPDTDHPEERVGAPLGELLAPTIEALERGVGAAAGRDGRYVVRWNDAYQFGSAGYGLVSELEREGIDAGVDESWRVPVTPQRVIPIEETTAQIIFATGGYVDAWRADDRVIEVASVDIRTADERAEFEALRRALIEDLENTGRFDLVPLVDTNLFAVGLGEDLSDAASYAAVRMLYLGQEAAVFIAPPGVAT